MIQVSPVLQLMIRSIRFIVEYICSKDSSRKPGSIRGAHILKPRYHEIQDDLHVQ